MEKIDEKNELKGEHEIEVVVDPIDGENELQVLSV